MDAKQFQDAGKQLMENVSQYLEDGVGRRVNPVVEPDYLRGLLPGTAPENGEDFSVIMKDFEKFIVPGILHWQSTFFHGFYPGMTSYPSILAEVIIAAYNGIGFTWASNPACTDLELVVLDWLARMLQLPKTFFSKDEKGNRLPGGSIIQCTASDSVMVVVLSARTTMLEKLAKEHQREEEISLVSKFVGYQSDQTHTAFQKACRIAMIQCRTIETDNENRLDPERLQQAIDEDLKKGLFPIVLCATLGTTSTCAFDNLLEIGPICNKYGIWLHVDAAYAGSAFVCPEYRPLLDGVELADSFNFNCHKWMLTNFDCSPVWFKDKMKVVKTFSQDFVMFEKHLSEDVVDFKDMQIPLGRRFRALKLWIILRCYGVKGIQDLIYRHTNLAKYFKELMEADTRFEVLDCRLGLVTFRLKGTDLLNDQLVQRINTEGRIYMTPTFVKDQRILRFAICAERASEYTIDISWKIIQDHATQLLSENHVDSP